ncbi:hypothetical protein Cantr_02020 [Candida viswanathii]|uniref:DNA2/NAM7 helicase-like C-terminal domain-containing protein n=1 Tax=Candida viswanathii TaxID=5486 RepID=A0A367YKU5_9ASCO|nr:hypothetical protein Cantr_02020 [Candida viswanathii]
MTQLARQRNGLAACPCPPLVLLSLGIFGLRSNYTGQIGFLKDERRLNVALTRARHSMIFIGHVECLKRGSKVWRQYLDFLRSKGAIHNEAEFVY